MEVCRFPDDPCDFEDNGNTLIFAWAAGGPIDTYRNAAASAAQPNEEGVGSDPVAEDSEAPPVELPAAEAKEPRGAVVFMSENRDGNWELYRANSTGGDLIRLTDDPAADGLPAVSPDGQQNVFISKRGDAGGLWVMPAAGGEARSSAIDGELPDWLMQAVDWPQ